MRAKIITVDFRRRFLGRILPAGPGSFQIDEQKLALDEVQPMVDGKRALALVCGYNSSGEAALTSYRTVIDGLMDADAFDYDVVFLVIWPTSTGPGYLLAEAKTYWDGFIPGVKLWEGVGNRLHDVLKSLPYLSIDFIAHSLGNGVVLDAMKDGDVQGVRYAFLTAPAVTATSVCFKDGKFLRAVQSVNETCAVLYSEKDDVLARAFRLAHAGAPALGWGGPPKGRECPANMKLVNASSWGDGSHSSARKCPEYYRAIADIKRGSLARVA